MTIYKAPPDQNGLVLNNGDTLQVLASGTSTNTTINSGGTEDVYAGGTSINTAINAGGTEDVSMLQARPSTRQPATTVI